MLVKRIELRKKYISGFDDINSKIDIEIYDLDRCLTIKEGNEITGRMMFQFEGMKLGLEMSGYQVSVEKIINIDMVTGKTREEIISEQEDFYEG